MVTEYDDPSDQEKTILDVLMNFERAQDIIDKDSPGREEFSVHDGWLLSKEISQRLKELTKIVKEHTGYAPAGAQLPRKRVLSEHTFTNKRNQIAQKAGR